jgi:uncharacterized membrane protein YoaK (UPF0700 family)
MAQHLTAALLGGPRLAWMPYLLLWLALVVGAMAGGVAYSAMGLRALWIAVGFAAVLLAGAVRLGPLPAAG